MKYALTYLLVAIAAILDAIIDTLHFQFDKSIFKNFNPSFWNPLVSYNFHPKFLGVVELDAYHLLKYVFLFVLFLAITMFVKWGLKWWANILILFAIWGVFFELFYSHVLV